MVAGQLQQLKIKLRRFDCESRLRHLSPMLNRAGGAKITASGLKRQAPDLDVLAIEVQLKGHIPDRIFEPFGHDEPILKINSACGLPGVPVTRLSFHVESGLQD